MSYQSFGYHSHSNVANFEELVSKTAILPENHFEHTATKTTVILKEAADVVYAGHLPIVIDTKAIDDTHIAKIKRYVFNFGDNTIHMAFVMLEEHPNNWLTEFVTPHPNATVPVYYIGHHHPTQSFFAKVLIRPAKNYPKDVKNIPNGFIHERFMERLMDAKDNTEFFKLMVVNGNYVDRYRVVDLKNRAKFILDLTRIDCFGHEKKVLNTMEGLIHSLLHIKTNTKESHSGRLDMVLALNALIHADIVRTYSNDLMHLSEYGSFVVSLFEPS